MERFDTAIIGGGAAGIVAAISARQKSGSVSICEKMPRLGKKILASGGGRCNLLNENLREEHYSATSKRLIKAVFARFGGGEIFDFFKKLGLELYSEDGRIFPVTNQSSSVLRVLEVELKRLSVAVALNFDVVNISDSGVGFVLTSKDNRKTSCRKLIMACGGKTYPALGSDGSSYRFAEAFGHRTIEPVPSAVPIVVVKKRLTHLLQGQRIFAGAKGILDGEVAGEASGDVLFTKYGLSGTAMLDISEDISIAINRLKKKDVSVCIDMVPFMKRQALKDELARRAKRGIAHDELLAGILPNRFGIAFKDLLKTGDLDNIVNVLKNKCFKVHGTRGWNEAEFTSGGINADEVEESTLESKFKKGLYFAGEILDVQGKRGGYNLAWAWASGYIAGLTE